jgi:ribosome maturation factor RimP
MSEYTDELLDKIRQMTAAHLSGAGYELVDASLSVSRAGIALRFLVDRPSGGISLAECVALNEELGALLDKENVIESYTLEVSSPGIDRPLVNEKDFLRVLGRRIRVFLKEPLAGKIEYEGTLENVKENSVFLSSGEIPLDKIRKAKQVIT